MLTLKHTAGKASRRQSTLQCAPVEDEDRAETKAGEEEGEGGMGYKGGACGGDRWMGGVEKHIVSGEE